LPDDDPEPNPNAGNLESSLRFLKFFAATLFALFFAFALVVDRLAGATYSLMIVTGMLTAVSGVRPDGLRFLSFLRRYWLVSVAMALPLLAVLINQLVTQHYAARAYDAQSRLALFFFMLWLLMFLPLDVLKRLQWPMALGAVLALVKMYILTEGGTFRYGTDFIPIIICAHMGLLLGVFSTLSLGWSHPHSRLHTLTKLAALGAGLGMAYLSWSRGVWMTIPVYAAISSMALKHVKRSYKLAALGAFVVIVAGSLVFGHSIQQRMEAVQTDLAQYSAGSDKDTSLGTRLQLWTGSWVLFKEHPLVGVGIDRYQKALKELAERKIISPLAATYPHSHNEMLFMMVRLGTLGALALLAIYLVPLVTFARQCRHADQEIRCSAAMGMSLVAGFIVLGLVDVVFLWWECYPFYGIGVAYCLACIHKRQQQLELLPRQIA
jgi:O-antigen ligase